LSTTWTVTSTADDGAAGTLRYAIDHSSSGDSIQFDPGALNAQSQTQIHLSGTQLEISHGLSIIGPGVNRLAIYAHGSRLLAIDAGATVAVSGLELRWGYAGASYGGNVFVAAGASFNMSAGSITYGGAARGGGIYNAGSVSLSNTDVSSNGGGGSPYLGGGIYNDGALAVSGCNFGSNQYFSGGAIYNAGTMTVSKSTFSYNWTYPTLQASSGAAINNAATGSAVIDASDFSFNHAIYGAAISNSGRMTVTRSSFEYNNAYHDYNLYGPHPAGGGAIFNTGTLDLTNSTLYHNWTPDGGGGALYAAGSSILTVTNDTINANNAPGGGGIFAEPVASVSLHNSIVDGNTYSTNGDNSQTPSDITGPASGSFNLIGPGGSGSLANGIDGNIVGAVDPRLAPLLPNGTLAQSMALRPGSPAFDAGSAQYATDADGQPLATDQRGRPRVAGAAVDIGAYEAQIPLPPTLVTAAAGADEVQVSWAADPDAASYNVYRTTESGAPPASPIATGIAVRGFLDTSVTAGVTYYYSVTAVNAMAESTPVATPPAVPFLPVIEGTPGDDFIRLTSAGDQEHLIWTLGAASGKVRIDDPVGLTINGNGGADKIAVFSSFDPQFPDLTHFNGTFTIGGRPADPPQPGQVWDINRSTIYLATAGFSDDASLIRDQISAGYDGGAWDGAASPLSAVITSNAARNDPTHSAAIGYADGSDGSGINPASDTIELKYTLAGDANLDGAVDSADAITMARNYLTPGKSNWDQGNFNYDSTINLSDAQILQPNFGKTLTTTAAAVEAAATVVPPRPAPLAVTHAAVDDASSQRSKPSPTDKRHRRSLDIHARP
jgi:hypothetical protein